LNPVGLNLAQQKGRLAAFFSRYLILEHLGYLFSNRVSHWSDRPPRRQDQSLTSAVPSTTQTRNCRSGPAIRCFGRGSKTAGMQPSNRALWLRLACRGPMGARTFDRKGRSLTRALAPQIE
jgi:hypothetical protein